MVRQWEEVSKEEGKITEKRIEGGKLQVEQGAKHDNLWWSKHK